MSKDISIKISENNAAIISRSPFEDDTIFYANQEFLDSLMIVYERYAKLAAMSAREAAFNDDFKKLASFDEGVCQTIEGVLLLLQRESEIVGAGRCQDTTGDFYDFLGKSRALVSPEKN